VRKASPDLEPHNPSDESDAQAILKARQKACDRARDILAEHWEVVVILTSATSRDGRDTTSMKITRARNYYAQVGIISEALKDITSSITDAG